MPQENTPTKNKRPKSAPKSSNGKPTAQKERVLVTGAASGLGRVLIRRLIESYDVIGMDRHEFNDVLASRIEFHRARTGKRDEEEVLRSANAKTLIHLAFRDNPRISAQERHQFNVVGTMRLLDHCQRFGIEQIIILSSASVYGVISDNHTFITEDDPLRATQSYPEMRDRVEVDTYIQAWMYKNPEVRTVILRPVNILGPYVTNSFTRYIRFRLVPVLMGFDPMVQIIHEEDVVESITQAMEAKDKGSAIYNVTGPGEIPLRELLWAIGAEILPIPHFLAYPVTKALWPLHLAPFPPPQLDYARYPLIVSGKKIREEIGFVPKTSLVNTLRSLKRVRRHPIER